jgi:transcription antitermination factor NusG
MHNRWIVLNVRKRAEANTAQLLSMRGYEVEYPRMSECKNCAARCCGKAMFPGYVFCRFDATNPQRMVETPGVLSVVSFGSKVATVAEEELRSIRIAAASARCKETVDWAHSGSGIEVGTGPLAGVRGAFYQEGETRGIVISVSDLNRAFMVKLHRNETVVAIP